MITPKNYSYLSSSPSTFSKVMNAAILIDEEILKKIRVGFITMSLSELEALIITDLTIIFKDLKQELEYLSETFWNKSLEEPIDIDEAFAAFILNFLENFISQQINFRRILREFASSGKASFEKILRRLIFSQELLSFNISALLLFSQLRFFETISSEISIYYTGISSTYSFIPYLEEFREFLFRHSMFIEYFENLRSRDYSEPFEQIVEKVLSNIVIVDRTSFTRYNVDGFTTYDRKIYLIEFDAGRSELNKGGTFYVLLHELCHLFRRVPCKTWRESMEYHTPTTTIGESVFSEAGDMFEIFFLVKDIVFST